MAVTILVVLTNDSISRCIDKISVNDTILDGYGQLFHEGCGLSVELLLSSRWALLLASFVAQALLFAAGARRRKIPPARCQQSRGGPC